MEDLTIQTCPLLSFLSVSITHIRCGQRGSDMLDFLLKFRSSHKLGDLPEFFDESVFDL